MKLAENRHIFKLRYYTKIQLFSTNQKHIFQTKKKCKKYKYHFLAINVTFQPKINIRNIIENIGTVLDEKNIENNENTSKHHNQIAGY